MRFGKFQFAGRAGTLFIRTIMEIWFNPAKELDTILRCVAGTVGGFSSAFSPEMRPADPRFGDYQANGVLAEAKRAKANPRALATALVDALKNSGEIDSSLVEISIAGPGFINFKLSAEFLAQWLVRYRGAEDLHKSAESAYRGKKVVIDYPSTNTAKQMHVGHLRIMDIGEAIARLLAFCGADLVRDNHIGDWGTNFGVLMFEIKRQNFAFPDDDELALEQLEELYKSGTAFCKDAEKNPGAMDAARAELVKLQQGDAENLALWERIVRVSNAACEKMYDVFGVKPDVTLGESFYRDKVGRVYSELTECGIAEEDDGALIVWNDDDPRYSRHNENAAPFIVRKKDGGSNYASTDLATLLYRVEHFKADEVVYVTDDRQCDHFRMLFLTAARWFKCKNYTLPSLRHVSFGKILGANGKPLKTKEGGTIRLKALVAEAVERAFAIVSEKNPDLSEPERRKIAETIGVAAIRYVDLMSNRTGDYMFAWDRLLAFEGNTAPYLLYAVARIRSVFRKAGTSLDAVSGDVEKYVPATDAEISLAKKLLGFSAAVQSACDELKPHHICGYLFDLAGAFSSFYNADKVMVDDPAVRALRLRLCARTCTILETGLRLLGIEPLERM